VTERIRLITKVLLGPWRLNAALVAKQVASLQHLSNGRMVLGIGVGDVRTTSRRAAPRWPGVAIG